MTNPRKPIPGEPPPRTRPQTAPTGRPVGRPPGRPPANAENLLAHMIAEGKAAAEPEPVTRKRTKPPVAATPEPTRAPSTKPRVDASATRQVSRAITKRGKTKKASEFDEAVSEILTKYQVRPQYPANLLDPTGAMSTGLYCLDLILSGGLHKGRMYTLYGQSSVGKSTLCQLLIKIAQQLNMRIYHFDPESATEADYAGRQGAYLDDSYKLPDGSQGYLYFPDVKSGEDIYRVAINMLRLEAKRYEEDPDYQGPPRVLVLNDSYASFTSEGLKDDKAPLGAGSRMHSSWQDRYRQAIRQARAVSVATNQTRVQGIGTMYVREGEAGGNALRFFADVRIEISSSQAKTHHLPEGVALVTFSTRKNRTTVPFQKAKSWMVVGRGYDPLHDRLSFLVMTGAIERVGAYFVIDGKKLHRAAARKLMTQRTWIHACEKARLNPEIYRRLLGINKLMEESWEDE